MSVFRHLRFITSHFGGTSVALRAEENVELEETGNSDVIRFTLKALHPERQPLGPTE
jgi:hypothetical protein